MIALAQPLEQLQQREPLRGIQRRQRIFADARRPRDRRFDHLAAFAGQADYEPPGVFHIPLHGSKPAFREPIDHPFDSGHIHRRQSAQAILRAGHAFVQLGERRELSGRQILHHQTAEQGNVSLSGLPKNESNLVVEDVTRINRRRFASRSAPSSFSFSAHKPDLRSLRDYDDLDRLSTHAG
jgi:hypothetical protein